MLHLAPSFRRSTPLWFSSLVGILLFACSAGAADITSNLLTYFKLNETSGTTAVDSAPGAPSNSTYSTDITANAMPGKYEGGINFVGNLKITMSQAQCNLTNGLAQVTIAAWVKPNVAAAERCLIEYRSVSNATRLSMRIVGDNTANRIRGLVRTLTEGNHSTDGPTGIPVGTLVHLAMTVDLRAGQKAMLLYVNGVQVAQNAIADTQNTIENNSATQLAQIGAQPTGTAIPCNDVIDEMRIYGRVLTAAEIQALMNLTATWNGSVDSSWINAANWDNLPASSNVLTMNFPGTTLINSNNDSATQPFQVGQLNHSNTSAGPNVISGNQIQFSTGGSFNQSSATALNFNAPLDLAGNMTFGLTGSGAVTLGGQLTGAGGATVSGTGTLKINNTGTASTNSGLFTVAGTTLEVDSAFGTSGVTLSSGAVKGIGTIGGTLTANGGVIAPGINNGQTATLTVASLVLNGGAAVNFDLNDTPAGTNFDSIAVTGALVSGGTVNFNLGPGFTGQTGFPKTYTLITSTSAPSGPVPLIGTITGGAFHVSNIAFSGNNLTVTFDPGAAVTGTWSTNATPENWNTPGNWLAGTVPVPGVATTLNFPTLGFVNPYTANNNVPSPPYVLNLLNLNSNTNGNVLGGSAIKFDGGAPAIQQQNSGSFDLQMPVSLASTATIVGNGSGALTILGTISGAGGISNTDPNLTLTLNNAAGNTYTGNTTINNGSLVIANTTGSITGTGNVAMAAGTSLSGAGKLTGSLTFTGATTLNPGATAGAIGSIASGPLTLDTNTNISLDLAAPGTSDVIAVTGNLTLAGNLNVTNSGGNMATGDYTLFTFTGTATDQGPQLFAPNTFGYQLTTTGGAVKLKALAAGGTSTWAGTGTTTWAKLANWDTLPGSSPTTALVFPTLAAAYTANNNIVGGITANSITITDTGIDSITGNAIALSGTTPTVNLSGAGGTFTISNPIALNANAVFQTQSGALLNVNGVISGTGGISYTGTGRMVIGSGTNTFTGATNITGGTLILQNTAGTPGISNTGGALGVNATAISISNGELQVSPLNGALPRTVTNLDRPLVFENNSSLRMIPPTNGNFNPAGGWTINAVDATPAVVHYGNSNPFNAYFGVPVLTATPINTLKLDIGPSGVGGVMDFGPGLASTINCKVVFSGVLAGNPQIGVAGNSAGRFYLNNGPYVQAAGTAGLFFENVVQIVPGNGSRVLNTDITVNNGILAIQGRGTGTNFEAGTHDLILSPNHTLRVKNGAALNIDQDFRGDQNNTGGLLLFATTVIEDNATITLLNTGTRSPATHPYRTHVIGSAITGSGPTSTLILNQDTHEGGYVPIDMIVTDGAFATVTTAKPHGYNSGDFVCITHNETEAGTGGTPAPPLPTPAAGPPAVIAVAGTYQVTVTSPTTFTYLCAAAATTFTNFTVKPVAGQYGTAFANTDLPVGTANNVCSLVVNGGLIVTTTGNAVGSNQGSSKRLANLFTAARLAGLTGTGGYLAPKPKDVALTIPGGWDSAVPVALLVSHNVPTGTDITLGGTFNNDIVVGATPTPADAQAQLDGGAQTIGKSLRGYGVLTGSLTLANGAAIWPGTSLPGATLAADEGLNYNAQPGNSIDFSLGGFLKIVMTKGATVNTQFLSLQNGPLLTLGGSSRLAIGIGPGNYGGVDVPIVRGVDGVATIFAPFTNVTPLPPSWKIVYRFNGADLLTPNGTPTLANPADTIVVRTTNANVTPVTIDTFTAQLSGAGVLLEWNAVSEFQNAGFDLFRRAEGAQNWERVNPALIPGRITNPDGKHYHFFDWCPVGVYSYKLESVSVDGVREAWFAEPLTVDSDVASSVSEESLAAAEITLAHAVQSGRAQTLGAEIRAWSEKPHLNPVTVRQIPPSQKTETPAAPSAAARELDPAAPRPLATPAKSSAASRAQLRWFSAVRPLASPGYNSAKVVYDSPGVLLIPQSMLPAGFDAKHVSIQREGRALNALALTPAGLVVHATGYSDDYTNKDALFLRPSSSATPAAQVNAASGLFSSTLPVNVTSPATALTEFHDVYFDYDYRPYTFTPWFSSKYLASGSSQAFVINTPRASSGAATLTLNLWSLTEGAHTLQAALNGTPIGQASWSGGNRMMQLSLDVPGNVLRNGANQLELVTPSDLGELSFLHSIGVSYTEILDAASPLEIVNSGASSKLYEVSGLPAAGAWVVDARFSDRATLVPAETLAQAGGSYRLRFMAASGGSGRFLVVPVGHENRPLSVTKRTVAAPKFGGGYFATGPQQFGAGVQPLLLAHQREGLRGAFVDQEQLFDYYNFGRFGPDGIRGVVRALKPKYLLLLGRTTYDYKNYSGSGVDPLCPAYLVSTTYWAQTTSDSKFGDLGRGFSEVAIGRLPVNNAAELSVAVSRVTGHKPVVASSFHVHAVADRADPGAGDFPAQLETLHAANPDAVWDANYLGVSAQTPAEITAALRAAANTSADVVLYAGHGNSTRLGKSLDSILDVKLVQEWTGGAVFLQATCAGHWMAKNETGFKSIAIQALTQSQGGISASIGTSTYMSAEGGAQFMGEVLRQAGSGARTRWGDALLKAQQRSFSRGTSYDMDLHNTEQLFGDPAMLIFAAPRASTTTGSSVQPGSF